jgi:subtilase family serine protease
MSAGVTAQALAISRAHSNTALPGRMHPLMAGHPKPHPGPQQDAQIFCRVPSATYRCYLPAQIRNAYSIQPLLSGGQNGAGVTIVIIDAFQDPTIADDLARFDAVAGLGPPPSFRTYAPFGLAPYDVTDADQVLWSGEVAIDVEWAHATAPQANIDLVLAPTDSDADVAKVEKYVIDRRLGDVVSMSYGDTEQCQPATVRTEEHAAFRAAVSHGMTLVAGSGDWGAAEFTCDGSSFIKAVAVPSSDPLVTAVGGTTLDADLGSGAYHNETTWNEGKSLGAGGGGFSVLNPRPDYQAGIGAAGSTRGVPDVAFNASEYNGIYVSWASADQPFTNWSFGGTSVGTPQWAGLIAIADQVAGRGLGNVNPILYQLPKDGTAFRDINNGDNDWPPITGFKATKGWDAATGLGAPIADDVVYDLVTRSPSQ